MKRVEFIGKGVDGMGSWFPRLYDVAMKPLEATRFKKVRKELVRSAEGEVLEIGSGTGVNFPYYKNVVHVSAVEPNPAMSERGKRRLQQADVPITVFENTAESLPFLDDTFDSVIATLVFCTIPDPEKALKEIQRVSKPGAKILFFEHVRMEQSLLGKVQDLLNPIWYKACDGCHLNRDTLSTISQAGIEINSVNAHYKKLFLSINGVNRK